MSIRSGRGGGAGSGTAPGARLCAATGPRRVATGRRREATRRRLFEAAVSLIAEQGFSATTVDEIADRAGVAKGTVYYNFTSKNVLYEELLRDGIDQLADSLRQAERTAAARGGSRVDALDAMIRAGLEFCAGSPALTQLYAAELWRTNRTWRATVKSVRGRALAVVESVLRDAVATGELTDELDIQLTASALFGMVLVAALDWQSFQPHRSVEDVHASLSRLVQGRVSGGA
ncbi:helix-turn-helix transcriptional regulator [Streptomyces piniterrae]|uniref:Helix-turn-helix transcriptional regulator n=1 Tax=Streptomyces piniterrae TaxID=2571125 RepID=A0A4U0NND9_9ACTN|nr:TetR/AcrR family transcriptional regulator [Streptomyces piniterrae]TJZ55915.1 helix-turn-helix transcriptional regulator [Streptomyces piniterrae]